MDINQIQQLILNSKKFNIWSNPNRPDDTQEGCCEYCGKKTGNNPLYVHVTVDGTCVPNILDENMVNLVDQSQGGFIIGQNCAKKLFGKEITNYTTK